MFGKMIAFIVRYRASVGRSEAPKRASHRLSRALAETLERRWLLSSAPHTLSQIGYFGANDTGANPRSTLVADTAGDLFGTTSAGGAYSAGTVFEIPAGTSTLITLASFNGADGADPQAGVTLDAAGNLYGTTSAGGGSDDGTVFEIAKGSTTIITLASFDGTNGDSPQGGVTLDSAGNLFGTTQYGGINFEGGATGDGTVFEIAKGSTTVTTLVSFNFTNGSGPQGGVTLDAAGNLYGPTATGGASGDGTVFEIVMGSNTVTTLASFNGDNGLIPDGGVTLDAAGNLYGATQYGGGSDDGTVFEIAKGSATVTTLASFNDTNGSSPNSVTLDAAGNLYGTTTFTAGASGDGTVFEIARGSTTVTTLVSFNFTNGYGPQGGVTLDAGGNLYGTTRLGGVFGNGTVFEIAKGSTTVTTLASFNGINGANPWAGVTLDAAGNLYGTTLAGGANIAGTVFEIARGSTTVTTLASFDDTNGAGPFAGVTLDAAGNQYGTTSQGGASNLGTVFEIAKGSATITMLASFNGTDGAYPRAGVTLDAAGNLYGTTSAGGGSDDGTVFEIAKGSTTITTLASFDGTNGDGPQGGVTLDSAGNLYGTTQYGGASGAGTVFEIAKGSDTVTTLVSFNFTNGSGPQAGVTLGSAGNLYGTTEVGGAGGDDYGTVFEIATGSTTVTTLASFNGTNGAHPYAGVTLDSAGNLYGTTRDGGASNAGTVFEIAKGSTTVTTLVSFNFTNGSGPQGGVTLDAADNLYGTTRLGGPGGTGTVFKLSPAVPGDANGDGKVDFADLVILARNYGMTNATWSDGDFNGDRTVGFDDLLILARNYGHSLPGTTAALGVSPSDDPLSLVTRRRGRR